MLHRMDCGADKAPFLIGPVFSGKRRAPNSTGNTSGRPDRLSRERRSGGWSGSFPKTKQASLDAYPALGAAPKSHSHAREGGWSFQPPLQFLRLGRCELRHRGWIRPVCLRAGDRRFSRLGPVIRQGVFGRFVQPCGGLRDEQGDGDAQKRPENELVKFHLLTEWSRGQRPCPIAEALSCPLALTFHR